MDEHDTEFDFDTDANESGTLEKASEKVRKLKAELEACKTQRQEYLDGWQRLRADIANQRRDEATVFEKAKTAATSQILEELLPALDAFDMAVASPKWGDVELAWRSGMEQVHAGLIAALERHGLQQFGTTGDPFDPSRHDAVAQIEGGKPATIESVLRKGYLLNNRVVRPAQVRVYA